MATYDLSHSHMNYFFRRIQAFVDKAIRLLEIRRKQKNKADPFEIELDENKEIIIEDYYW